LQLGKDGKRSPKLSISKPWQKGIGDEASRAQSGDKTPPAPVKFDGQKIRGECGVGVGEIRRKFFSISQLA